MKIDKITICNLTSIEGEQTIDFTQEPLKSAGLFAITGHTGAGKSTILDAICLALYNEAPRLGNRENLGKAADDNAPNIYNTCNMLRRGATQGYSHVTFSLNDGSQYMAKWTTGLTRNNTFKPLQRELVQLKPRHTTIADRNSEVQNQLKQILKLDYNQFTRTVILAQNSFTNFLSAKRGDKSQLLEKITGTEIYAEISRQIFLETKEAEKDYAGARQHMEGISQGLLADEDLQRAHEDLNLHRGMQTKFNNEQTRVRKQLEWYDEHDKAMAELEDKKAKLFKAQQAFNAMYDQQRELERYDRLQPFAPTYLNICSSETDINKLKNQISSKELFARDLKADSESAQQKHKDAQSRLLTAQQTLKSREADIRAGIKIGGQLATAKENLKITREDLQRHDDDITQRRDNYSSKETEHNDCTKRLASVEHTRQQMVQHKIMIDQIELVRSRLQQMNEMRQNIESTESALADSNRVLAHCKHQLQELKSEGQNLQATITRLQAELLIHEQANKGLSSSEIQARLNKLMSLDMRSGNAIVLWDRIDYLFDNISNKTDELRRRKTLNAQKEKEIAKLTATIEVLADNYERIHSNYTLSQSEDFVKKRQELKEGTACPLCGSTHHPFHSDSEQQLDQLLDNIKEQHEQATQELATARKNLTELQKIFNDEQGRLEVEEKMLQQKIKEQSDNISLWQQYADLDDSFRQCDENVNRYNRKVMLQQIKESASTELKATQQLLIDFNRHQDEINRINSEIQTTQQEMTVKQRQHSQVEAECNVAENKIADYQRTIEDSKMKLDESSKRIEPYMTISDWKERCKTSYEAFDRELSAIKTKWTECNEALQDEKMLQYKLDQELRALQKNIDDLNVSRQTTYAKLNVFEQQIANLEENLRTMFGSSTVEEESARLNKMVEVATNETQQALDLLNTAQQKYKGVAGEIQSLQDQCKAKEQEYQELRTKLDIDISRFNQGEDSTLQYFELSKYFSNPQEWSNIRQQIDSLKEQLNAISFKVEAANNTVMALDQSQYRPSDSDPDDSKNALVAKQEALVKQIEENQQILHNLEYKIKTHTDCVANIAAFKPTLDNAEDNYANWSKLNDVLGSADGKTFREIAQCYTFEFLVDFANQQLADLTSRYQLRTHPGTLQLEVIDRHMLDQVRAVNSLSGGESFIISLGLALGLSSLSSNNLEIGSLFIDEGFGNLDNANLNLVIDALSNLQNTQRRKVGVISHTEQIQSRISPKIQLESQPGGRSIITVKG